MGRTYPKLKRQSVQRKAAESGEGCPTFAK
jgi:hypothetical protein